MISLSESGLRLPAIAAQLPEQHILVLEQEILGAGVFDFIGS